MKLPNDVYTRYTYNAMHRLTDVVHYTQIPQENPPLPPSLSSFGYTLNANGMRAGVTEYVNENRHLAYQYDNLNRLVREDSYDAATMNPATDDGYTIQYAYDLVGNRKERIVTANGQTLTTIYDYDDDTDRLMMEVHAGPVAAVPYGDGQRIYAYADGSGGMVWQLPGSGRRIGQFGAFLRGLPSVWNRGVFYTLMLLIPVVMLWPVVVRQWSRIKGGIDPLASPDLKLWHRVLCVLLAYIFLVGPEAFHAMARAETQYSQLSTLAWGEENTIIEYQYDDNGSLTSKITTQSGTVAETIVYEYNLQNRLAKVTTTQDPQGTPQTTVVEYRYNPSGIRVEKTETTPAGRTETHYLVDPQNHTGYAQVLEETVEKYDSSDVFLSAHRIQYTIGDDVISQTRSQWSGSIWQAAPTQYMLYDGHGSTRQLVNSDLTIAGSYSYDGYGIMLSDNSDAAANAATSLLYCGEQYDSTLNHYYLRARYYNPNNGLFNRVDPYSGNMQDPQSLHKYLYCHANPINNIDPMGLMSLTGTIATIAITGIIAGITGGIVTKSWKGAVWGFLAGASLASIALLTYLQAGTNPFASAEVVNMLFKAVILSAIGGVIGALNKWVQDGFGEGIPSSYMEVFLRGFAVTSTIILMKQAILFGIDKGAESISMLAKLMDIQNSQSVIAAISAGLTDLGYHTVTGKIFTSPSQVMTGVLVSAGTAYLVARFSIHAAAAKGESEVFISTLSGFIASRVKDIYHGYR